jgi:hypothetical protein
MHDVDSAPGGGVAILCAGGPLSLSFLRVHNPQTRMTAWIVVLMASLFVPVLMPWATLPIPYSSLPDVAISTSIGWRRTKHRVQTRLSPRTIGRRFYLAAAVGFLLGLAIG